MYSYFQYLRKCAIMYSIYIYIYTYTYIYIYNMIDTLIYSPPGQERSESMETEEKWSPAGMAGSSLDPENVAFGISTR